MRYTTYVMASLLVAANANAFDIGGMIVNTVAEQVKTEIKNEAKTVAKDAAKETAKTVAKQQGVTGADKAIDFAVDNAEGIKGAANTAQTLNSGLTGTGKAFVGANLAVGALDEARRGTGGTETLNAIKGANAQQIAVACKGDAACMKNATAAAQTTEATETLGGNLVKGASGFLTGLTSSKKADAEPAAGK